MPLPKGLGEIGERWERSSYLQALGFLVLVGGTLVYGRGDEELDKQEVRNILLAAKEACTASCTACSSSLVNTRLQRLVCPGLIEQLEVSVLLCCDPKGLALYITCHVMFRRLNLAKDAAEGGT